MAAARAIAIAQAPAAASDVLDIAQPPLSPLALAVGVTQWPLWSQTLGLTQSPMLVQTVLHWPVCSHLYGVQSLLLPFEPVVV
jgi:hypothetical protein